MNIIQLKQLIEHIKSLPTPETPELTIFGIGSRGYYENPTSDVLAFFCDSEGDHGLGNLMTEALFDALTVSNQSQPILTSAISLSSLSLSAKSLLRITNISISC